MAITDSLSRPGGVSRGELNRRVGLIQAHLAERNLDALVAVGLDADLSGTTRWLTDTPVTYRKVVIVYPRDLMTVVDHGPMGLVRLADGQDPEYPNVGEIVTVSEFGSVHYTQRQSAEQVVRVLHHRGVQAVGLVNPLTMPSGFRDVLSAGLGTEITLHDETAFLDRAKAIKSPEEISKLEAAAALQDEILTATLAYIRPGIAEYEVSAFVTYEARRRGGDHGIALFGSNTAGRGPAFMRSSDKGARRIEAGDAMTLLIETGSPDGYVCELGRNAVLGRVAPEQQALHDLLVEAQAFSHALIRPGVAASEIAVAHDRFMIEHGLQPERRLYAHGQGYDLIERPLIRADENMLIEAGMHLAVHPAGVRDGYFGFVCDNVLVEVNGVRALHASPRCVYEIG
jgi:Xaa-Pro aminopeptidase